MAHRIAAGLAWQPLIEAYQASHPRSRSLALQGALPRSTWPGISSRSTRANPRAAPIHSTRVCTSSRRTGNSIGSSNPISGPSRAPRPAPRPAGARIPRAIAWNSAAGALIRTADTRTRPSEAERPLRPPAFTPRTSREGALAYYQNCAMCHGPRPLRSAGRYQDPHSRARISPIQLRFSRQGHLNS